MGNRKIADSLAESITKENPKYAKATASYLASVRHKLRRLEAGRCGWGGCQEVRVNANWCRRHTDYHNEKARIRRFEKGRS